jgi:hypothetical protein
VLNDGPFAEHYEATEAAISNPLHPKQTSSPVTVRFHSDKDVYGTRDQFPVVCTTYRLTELYHYWTHHTNELNQLQPEFFIEIPEDLFWAAALGTVGLLISGIVMWVPQPVSGQRVREASYIVHDAAFSLFFAMIIGHIYLGTAAEPGTFRSMVRGTVTKSWARLHHPRWYREVTGEEPRG